MRPLIFGLVTLAIGCSGEDRYERLSYSPPMRVKDRLLKLHPDWQPWDGSMYPRRQPQGVKIHPDFRLRGYLVATPEAKTRREPKALTILEGTPAEIKAHMNEPVMKGENWKGIVYVRQAPDGKYMPGQNVDGPGIYNDGTVVIRSDCLFYGDREMLKQINEDLK